MITIELIQIFYKCRTNSTKPECLKITVTRPGSNPTSSSLHSNTLPLRHTFSYSYLYIFQGWPIKTAPWNHVFVKHFGAKIWLCWFLKTHIFHKNWSNLYLNTILCSLVSEGGRGGCASVTVKLFRQWQYWIGATFVTVEKVWQWQWLT